jgi:lysophospholipase L1-like esterase
MVSGTSGHALYYNSTNFANVLQGGTIQVTAGTSTGTGVTAFHILSDVSRTNSAAARTDSNNLTVNGNYNAGQVDNSDNADTTIQLGAFNSANFGNLDIAEVLLYSKTLTRADTNNIIYYINGRYGTTVGVHNEAINLGLDGDSITAGLIGAPPFAMLTANHEAVFATDFGSQGAFMLDLKNQAATVVDPSFLPNVNNILSVFAGTNDIVLGGRTGAQVYADFQTYCAARHAVGWKVVAIDMLPRSVGSESDRTTLNADLDGDTCADAHVRTTCNTPMWAAGANTNATWYNADTIHPNTNGHSIIATCLQTAIESIPTVAYVPRSH